MRQALLLLSSYAFAATLQTHSTRLDGPDVARGPIADQFNRVSSLLRNYHHGDDDDSESHIQRAKSVQCWNRGLGAVPDGTLTCKDLSDAKAMADNKGDWSALDQRIVRGLADVYGPMVNCVDHRTKDSASEFKGPPHDQLYGEISFDGMMTILKTALRIAAGKEPTTGTFSEYELYDLGTGFGKFPAFAALLGMNATGIELDTHRAKVGSEMAQRMATLFGSCVAPKNFRVLSGSFTKDFTEWAYGTQKRIVVLDVKVSSGLDILFKKSKFGKDSVIASMGFEGHFLEDLGFKRRDTIEIGTSWSERQHANFYTRDSNFTHVNQ